MHASHEHIQKPGSKVKCAVDMRAYTSKNNFTRTRAVSIMEARMLAADDSTCAPKILEDDVRLAAKLQGQFKDHSGWQNMGEEPNVHLLKTYTA